MSATRSETSLHSDDTFQVLCSYFPRDPACQTSASAKVLPALMNDPPDSLLGSLDRKFWKGVTSAPCLTHKCTKANTHLCILDEVSDNGQDSNSERLGPGAGSQITWTQRRVSSPANSINSSLFTPQFLPEGSRTSSGLNLKPKLLSCGYLHACGLAGDEEIPGPKSSFPAQNEECGM
ncbi:hypothetical protein Bbelb_126790 [Branchiostoma belcheri]|nr:hypothetical protein Bbelb_126790 [Branchiostoma belcheri]